MAHWGVALANGPHINIPLVPPERAKAAWAALAQAREHAKRGTEVEQALIEALAKRYADPQPEDRRPLDEAYAAAMREVCKRFPKDARRRRPLRRVADGPAAVGPLDGGRQAPAGDAGGRRRRSRRC